MNRLFLLLLFVTIGVPSLYAQKTPPVTIPQKDSKPYYERSFALAQKGDDAFVAVKLFLAEYFKRSTPEIIVEDKAARRFAVKTCLFYHFLDNPETYRGRLLSLTDISFRNDSCTLRLYDWQVQHAGLKTHWVLTPQGWYPEGKPAWEAQSASRILEDAAKGRRRTSLELQALDKEVVKMLNALQEKLSAK